MVHRSTAEKRGYFADAFPVGTHGTLHIRIEHPKCGQLMAALVKPFGEHSQRWQREQLRKGVDPKKWDRWRKLSPAARKATNPFEYAKGATVRSQLRKPLLDAATRRLLGVHQVRGATRFDGTPIKQTAVRRNLDHPQAGMTNAKLRRIANLSPQKLLREVDDSLSRRYAAGERSPFWYEKRG